MTFHEKSAWIMSVALVLCGVSYFNVVSAMTAEIDQLAPPNMGFIIRYTVSLIAVAIIGHIAIAIFSPKDANAPLDERDKTVLYRAGHYSGYVLGFGVVTSLGHYLFNPSGDILFYAVFASIMVSQLSEYLFQILLYRIGV